MSSDLERLLREGWNALPGPEPEATEGARRAALAALGSRRRRLRSRLAVAAALVLALALGIAIGVSRAPSSAAAPTTGFGFLPADGWYVAQNGGRGTPERPAFAIASNVPLEPGDGMSIVPYATLQALPKDGIVLVASFVRSTVPPVGLASLPAVELPLKIRAATSGLLYGAQVRPERPLGQFGLRADVDGYAVDLHVYFGVREPPAELLAEAQRQLDGLVAAPRRSPGRKGEESAAGDAAGSAQAVSLRVVRVFDAACNCYRLRFSGQISPARAGEYVAVLRQPCGQSFGTAVAGAQTRELGFWEAATAFSTPPGRESATYRARWGTLESAPVRFRGRLFVSMTRIAPGRLRVTVQAGDALQSMAGKRVVLQRQAGGAWQSVASARLRADPSGAAFSTAELRTPLRGARVRAFLPKASVGPCFLASASETVRS